MITSVASGEMNDNGTEVKNPSLLGLESEEVNNFFIRREKYDRAVQEKKAGPSLERRVIKISIKTSIEESVLSLICELHLQIPEDEVTDDQLWAFLKDKCNQRLLESDEPIVSVFDEIDIDRSIKEAGARIENLWSHWYKIRGKYKLKLKRVNKRSGNMW